MSSARRVTIHDVASAAGVSVATVSKVINSRYGVAASTFERVQRVIDDLGYESSLVARTLRSRRTGVIGILVADFEPFSTELLKGAARAVRSSGYELVAYSAGGAGREQPGWERRYLNRLSGTLIDGAVLVTPTVVDVGYSAPVVAVDPHTGHPDMPTIVSDNLHGAVLATEHLISLGHSRIAFLAGRADLESAQLRETGFRQAMAAAGIPVDERLVRAAEYETETADLAAHALLEGPERPTAVFAANDLSAIQTIAVAHSLGLSVPADLSVVGFDNIPESAMCEPTLTTIDQPIQEMGFQAVHMLLELIGERPLESTHLTLPTELVRRRSTTELG
ncbi:LacI family DNA-binding transcriptional regulator [Angustibacter sp. McL0619]|uniref:LacI family DNA-binding transcriptional regulator n=1 Tax=Angustibacter sp. McL0619 TaxID=3415676 RepID=UPI003CE9F7F1